MKTLIIVRHAKSSWENITDDFNRPLNARGKHDAPEMAKKLLGENVAIDAFVSSPAKRAKKTAKLFIEEYQRSKDEIILVAELYNASLLAFYSLVPGLSPAYNTVAIFAHNPGVTEFVNSFNTIRIDDMPTCGVFAIKIHTEDWLDFDTAEKEFAFFYSPKFSGD